MWNFATEYNVLLNTSKTMCMKIGNNVGEPKVNITLRGIALVLKDNANHLKSVLTNDVSHSTYGSFKSSIFISQIDKLNVKFN